MILERGHRVGNHTFNHIKGPSYKAASYMANVEKANELIQSNLFRPPHGWMGRYQYHMLRRRYRIIMWDLVTRDYSKRLNGEQVFRILKHYVRNGSIITFHDSLKSERNLKYALPRSIEWLLQQGYRFEIL
jgi:peptidoglycan/xylan/chitin deacetylase (PgdA/CDA1 family)